MAIISRFNEVLIATGNQGKFSEIKSLLDSLNIKAVSPSQFLIEEPEETESSFQANSILKAKFYGKRSNITSLADDSGLCVEDLGGIPGIHSARFAIDPKNNQKNFYLAFQKIFEQLNKKGIDLKSKPKAHFICNLSIFDPRENFLISFEGRVDGYLVEPRGDNGFGYDPIFVKNGMEKTFGEIEPSLKDKISHRNDAFEKLKQWIILKN
jgi:XTP/dITP diphosphohydrolase